MPARIRLLCLYLLTCLVLACSDSTTVTTVNPAPAPAPVGTGTIIVRFDLEPQPRLIPLFVTGLRFTGLDAEGRTVFGPVVTPRQATVQLDGVPVTIRQLRIELLVGEQLIGIFQTPVTLAEGQTIEVTNIEWSLVEPPPQLVIDPETAVIPLGLTGAFTATRDPEGTNPQDVTADSVWTSSAPSILRVDGPGQVTSLTAGEATLTATLGDLVATAQVTVTDATLMSISFAPNSGKVMGSFQFRLLGQLSNGLDTDATTLARWSVDNTTVAVVNNNTAKGLVRTRSLGTANLTARVAGFSVSQPFQTVAGASLVSFNGANSDGGNDDSFPPYSSSGMSEDGRFVVFSSNADDLLPPGPVVDNNNDIDVFLRDTLTGQTTLISVDMAGTTSASGGSDAPSITPDGRFIIFGSDAPDLVATPFVGTQVFRRDLMTGITELVSRNQTADPANASSFDPQISDDGNLVCFATSADNVPTAGSTGELRIVVRNLTTGAVTVANVDNQGALLDYSVGLEGRLVMSGNGRVVAWAAITGPNPGGVFPLVQIFARDLSSGQTTLCSANAQGGQGNSLSLFPLVSRAGDQVFFSTTSTNLDPGGKTGLYRRDLTTGTLEFVHPMLGLSTSADGRFICLVDLSLLGLTRSQVLDRQTGAATPINVGTDGLPVNESLDNIGLGVGVSPDGSRIVFDSLDDLDPIVTTQSIFQIYQLENPLLP